MIAQEALNQYADVLGLDAVTFIPSGTPPHRHHEDDLLPAFHRYAMVSLATDDNPRFRVDPIECASELEAWRSSTVPVISYSSPLKPCYTVDTMRRLLEAGRIQTPVPFIIGSDALSALASWREPYALVEMACFLQAPRPGCEFVTHFSCQTPSGTVQSVRLNTKPIDMPTLTLSSSWVRRCLTSQTSTTPTSELLRYFVPDSVSHYIAKHHLYQPDSTTSPDPMLG